MIRAHFPVPSGTRESTSSYFETSRCLQRNLWGNRCPCGSHLVKTCWPIVGTSFAPSNLLEEICRTGEGPTRLAIERIYRSELSAYDR